jgi:hypothetical protein
MHTRFSHAWDTCTRPSHLHGSEPEPTESLEACPGDDKSRLMAALLMRRFWAQITARITARIRPTNQFAGASCSSEAPLAVSAATAAPRW